MKKTLSWIFLFIAFFLLVASYFLSEQILTPSHSKGSDDANLRNQISFSEFNLPTPESIRFQNGVLRLRGWYFKNPKKQNCGMIFLHGLSNSKIQMLPYATPFWKRGCSLFLYDARAHGESDGQYSTYGYHEKMDLERAVEYFSEIDNTPEDRIGIFGIDFGASTALQFADGQFEYGFVIADTPYKDMRSYVEKRYESIYSRLVRFFLPLSLSIAELRGDLLVDEVSPQHTAKMITNPVLVLFPNDGDLLEKEDAELIVSNLKTTSKKIAPYPTQKISLQQFKTTSPEYELILQSFLKEIKFVK
ncbi:dipeptidyl aminopeptidase [Leptospira levettii]|uniref:alpha/beta hydrolase n=1 Tax=Leptospira levettii TaxID=2023178 RepID=UPI000C298EE6|nr:alpha/beta hydrolase [Leptospira levettii]PJZ36944.1 dipeptidyl aminopeptidase [Leptospira levettii]PJZ88217.1 dipeptidyl aminopeptidase [Leptospira levettii]PKA00017.1 dipeptidyl aminopeptidase [Leptospira levettii]